MMFASNSPYSPFFTSGLLCHSIFDGIRRGSLPTDSSKDVQSPFIFSNQPEYRSFLSLDLAESQSMRSASLKRKHVAPPLVLSLSIYYSAHPSPENGLIPNLCGLSHHPNQLPQPPYPKSLNQLLLVSLPLLPYPPLRYLCHL